MDGGAAACGFGEPQYANGRVDHGISWKNQGKRQQAFPRVRKGPLEQNAVIVLSRGAIDKEVRYEDPYPYIVEHGNVVPALRNQCPGGPAEGKGLAGYGHGGDVR